MLNLPTELLRSFVAAIDLGSFTRAGEAVGRSQSAVSLQMQRLEQLLDATLFERGAHRMRLTTEGTLLAGYARRMLALNDEAVGSLGRPKVAGAVSFGAPHEYTASLLPVILGKFARAYPRVSLEVSCDLSKNLLARQALGELDLVLALHDGMHDDVHDAAASVQGVKVADEPLTWITSVDHSRHQERTLPLVVAPPPCIYRGRMLRIAEQRGRPYRIAYTSSSYSGILAAVRAGLGVTLLASSTVPEGVRTLGRREGFPEMGELELRLHHAGLDASPAVRCLADYVASSFA